MIKKIFFCLNLIIISLGAYAQLYVPGQTYFSNNGYVEYIYGNIPIIITAPHGGLLVPASIPDRTTTACGGTATTSTDLNTAMLARAIDSAFVRLLGCHPFVVIGLLKRTKIDLNRDFLEATCGDPVAEQTWIDYHNFIYNAKNKITQQFGRGLYLDIHGHGHMIQRLEMGYNITAASLRTSDNNLNTNTIINESTIKNLTVNSLSNDTHAALIRGTNALGTLLANKGYQAVPSMQDVAPLATEDYFNGGYNIERWGTKDSGTIDAIQIECYNIGIRDNITNIKKFADSLAKTVKEYIQTNIVMPLTCTTTLPLNLTSFTAAHFNDIVKINWITEEETAVSKYELQRSYNGINFIPLTSIVPLTNSSGTNNYEYIDYNLLTSDKIYYRLKILENDGAISYSAIVQVKLNSLQNSSHIIQSIFPNPSSANNIKIVVVVSKKANYRLQIMNINGQILSTKFIKLHVGKQQIEIAKEKFAAGLYFINLYNLGTSEIENAKIIFK